MQGVNQERSCVVRHQKDFTLVTVLMPHGLLTDVVRSPLGPDIELHEAILRTDFETSTSLSDDCSVTPKRQEDVYNRCSVIESR